jgi:hypothetical protein
MPLSLRPPGSGHADNTRRQTRLLQTLGLPGQLSALKLQALLHALHSVPEAEHLPLIEASSLLHDSEDSTDTKRRLASIVLGLARPPRASVVIQEIGQPE